jgi:hypothetical protein
VSSAALSGIWEAAESGGSGEALTGLAEGNSMEP